METSGGDSWADCTGEPASSGTPTLMFVSTAELNTISCARQAEEDTDIGVYTGIDTQPGLRVRGQIVAKSYQSGPA